MQTYLPRLNANKWIIFLFLLIFQSLATAQDQQDVTIPGLYRLPETSVENTEKNLREKSSVREDLHKYMGYERDPERYLSLPFDVFMNNNLHYIITDVGFLIILLLPILFLLPLKKDPEKKPANNAFFNMAAMVFFTLFLIISIPSAYLNKNKLNTPQEGLELLKNSTNTGALNELSTTIKTFFFHLYEPFYHLFFKFGTYQNPITYPLIFLLFFAVTGAIFYRLQRHTPTTKAIILFLAIYFFFWWTLGSGAPWYGILLFCVPYIFLTRGIIWKKNNNQQTDRKMNNTLAAAKSGLLLIICSGWVLMAFTFRSTNYTPMSEENGKNLYIPPIVKYQTGESDKKTMVNTHLPGYYNISNIINQEDESLVYRVGTLIHYFIKKNDRRVFTDTFLDFFDGMIKRFQSKEKIVQALKASGFKYIIIDLNMASNDFTPEKSLTRKFIQLLNTIYNNPGLELVYTDRTIQLNSNGQVVNAVFEDKGKIVNLGTIALFRIK